MPDVKSIKYTRKSSPKMYKGVQLDSFLEYKWARFFDACGIEWIRPEKALGKWLPDFIIKDDDARHYYVEVKPIRSAPPKDLCVLLVSNSLPITNLLVLGQTPRKHALGWDPRTGQESFKLENSRQGWDIYMKKVIR